MLIIVRYGVTTDLYFQISPGGMALALQLDFNNMPFNDNGYGLPSSLKLLKPFKSVAVSSLIIHFLLSFTLLDVAYSGN